MSAVLKPIPLETIFDHAVTEQELSTLLFGDSESFAEYSQFLDQDSAYADISRLFRLRSDENSAVKYIKLIANPVLKAQFSTIPCSVAGRSAAEQPVSA